MKKIQIEIASHAEAAGIKIIEKKQQFIHNILNKIYIFK